MLDKYSNKYFRIFKNKNNKIYHQNNKKKAYYNFSLVKRLVDK